MTTHLRAIPTRYAGCHFRSRLEARYAVFFDRLELRWDYEPQGYALPSGPYLPDFYLHTPRGGTWFEVKPSSPDGWHHSGTIENDPRFYELAQATETPHITANGLPTVRDIEHPDWGNGTDELWLNGDMDHGYQFCICLTCHSAGVEFEGRWGRICQHFGDDADDSHSGSHTIIIDAYTAARSARFEHGQSGATA